MATPKKKTTTKNSEATIVEQVTETITNDNQVFTEDKPVEKKNITSTIKTEEIKDTKEKKETIKTEGKTDEKKDSKNDTDKTNETEIKPKKELNTQETKPVSEKVDLKEQNTESQPPHKKTRYEDNANRGNYERRDYGNQREGGYRREGGYQQREGGYQQREGGYRREGGYQQRDGGYRREGGYQQRDSRPRRDQEPVPPSAVLGFFGLKHVEESDIREFLNENISHIPYGDVKNILNRETQTPRGFAFVYFESIEDATKAKEALEGKTMRGNPIRIDYSKQDNRNRERSSGL